MKTNKLFALCLSTLLIVGSAGIAFAQGDAGEDPRMADPLALYRMAGINGDQEEQIRKLAKDFEDAQRVRAKTAFAKYKELSDLQLQPDPVEEDVLAKQEEINKVIAEMATERMKLLLKVRKVLTPDQRKKLVALLGDKSGPGKVPAAAPDEGKAEGP
ncbi:MAG: periplasmic heavy metal sensor [Candidatus Obscuribacterales bacterium]|nr:periplasmic heavy metal sensor [Candidatus Obscuribacterales bacterium]